jgi:hypothetical protein
MKMVDNFMKIAYIRIKARRYRMANLQVKEINPHIYANLKDQARKDNRSVSQEVVSIIKEFLSRKQKRSGSRGAEVLLQLAGAWEDKRGAAAIVKDLKKARRNTRQRAFG